EKDGNKRFGKGPRGLQIQSLEGGIFHFADHHGGEEKHEDWPCPFPISLGEFLFVPPPHEQSQRSDQTRCGGYGKSEELLAAATACLGSQTVEASQTKRATD